MQGTQYQLDILDTAGQEEFMRDNYYVLGDGFLVVYSITMRDSFEAVPRFHDHILQVKGTDSVAMVVVASKSDLELNRQTSADEGAALAERLHCPFFETSAKSRVNVDACFNKLIVDVMTRRAPAPAESKGCCVLQ